MENLTQIDTPSLEHNPFANPSFKLSEKREAYARARAAGMGKRAAAVHAGFKPSSAQNQAWLLEKREDVAGRIAEIQARSGQRLDIDLKKLLTETMACATVNLQDALDENGELLPVKDWPDHVAAAVQTVDVQSTSVTRYDPEGREIDKRRKNAEVAETVSQTVVRIRFWPKLEALEKLLKYMGAYAEDNEQKRTKKVDLPEGMTAEQMAERYVEIINGASVSH